MINETLIPQAQEQLSHPSNLIKYLYIAHFLARWGARMWEFSVGLYMISLWPDSLLFAAIYGAVESASTAVFGPIVGQWVDKLTYVKVLKLWLVTQNVSFIVAGGTVKVLLGFPGLKLADFVLFVLLVILTNISGAVGVLSTLAGTILIEREWVVVISEGHSPEKLTEMNSVMRRIDLTCTLCAPVLTGFIITFVSLEASVLTLTLWNTLSVWLEYWLFISVYNGVQALQQSSHKRLSRSREQESSDTITEKSWKEKFTTMPYLKAWSVYLQQDVVLPGISLALLFFTVLSFGTLMTAFLEWRGIPAYVIGIARGINAVSGIGATLVYPAMRSRISTLQTGFWSIWFQWMCLLVCVASIWVGNDVVSACMLMSGVAISRLGLWAFDLSVVQHMQDGVAESDRCVVGGVQNSLQSTMDLMAYVMAILVYHPQDFCKLILVSFGAVTFAAVLFTSHLYSTS